jgi:hypothetical protein
MPTFRQPNTARRTTDRKDLPLPTQRGKGGKGSDDRIFGVARPAAPNAAGRADGEDLCATADRAEGAPRRRPSCFPRLPAEAYRAPAGASARALSVLLPPAHVPPGASGMLLAPGVIPSNRRGRRLAAIVQAIKHVSEAIGHGRVIDLRPL